MKIITFYLPQFHMVPENDKWWGKGYTEWTAVKRAKVLYEGHYQPHKPMFDNYYNLLQKDTMVWQSQLMHEYGIDGMCFYHYWFGDGKKVLEKPAENLLKWKDVNMPFCFSWANESWVNSWNSDEGFVWTDILKGSKKKKGQYIFEQKYGREMEWDTHLEYLAQFFCDKRYIRIDGKPLIHIYRPEIIPCLEQMLYRWRKKIRELGFDGLYILGGGRGYRRMGVDGFLTHEPGNVRGMFDDGRNNEHPTVFSYDMANQKILEQRVQDNLSFSAFCSYDNTPRYGDNGVVFDADPRAFELWLAKIMAKNSLNGKSFTFIDAWNEWGEGMHLEPDMKYGYDWLNAVKNAKNRYTDFIKEVKDGQIGLSESEKRVYSDSIKADLYYRTALKWMELKERGLRISIWFKQRSINRFLIYGYSLFAKMVFQECTNDGIIVDGIIDQSPRVIFEDITCYGIEGNYPYEDVIIVTSFFYMNEIHKSLVAINPDAKIYSLNEIISDMTGLK